MVLRSWVKILQHSKAFLVEYTYAGRFQRNSRPAALGQTLSKAVFECHYRTHTQRKDHLRVLEARQPGLKEKGRSASLVTARIRVHHVLRPSSDSCLLGF